MLLLATLGAARVLGLDGQTGSLTPGKLADVTVVSTEPFGLGGGDAANHVVFQANATDVDAVFVAGEPRVRDGELVDVDLARMREGLDLTRDYVLGRSPDAEWEELSPAVRAHYEAHQGAPIA